MAEPVPCVRASKARGSYEKASHHVVVATGQRTVHQLGQLPSVGDAIGSNLSAWLWVMVAICAVAALASGSASLAVRLRARGRHVPFDGVRV
jgi:hypothetical protein